MTSSRLPSPDSGAEAATTEKALDARSVFAGPDERPVCPECGQVDATGVTVPMIAEGELPRWDSDPVVHARAAGSRTGAAYAASWWRHDRR